MTHSIRMMPMEIIALQMELRNHPELRDRIDSQSKTFEDIIALLAAEFDIVMHGVYAEPEVLRMCRLLVQKMQDKRKVIITSPEKFILPAILPPHLTKQ